MWRGAQNSIRPKTAGTYRVIVVVFLPVKIGEIIFFWKGWFNQREWIVLVESGSLAIGREQKAKPGGKTSLEPLPHCTLAKTNIALAGLPKRELIFWPQCFSCYASFSEGCIVGYFSFWCDTFRTVISHFLMLWLGSFPSQWTNNLNNGNIFLFDRICCWVFFSRRAHLQLCPGHTAGQWRCLNVPFCRTFRWDTQQFVVALLVGPVMHWILFPVPLLFNSKTTILNKKSHETEQHIPTNYRSLNI